MNAGPPGPALIARSGSGAPRELARIGGQPITIGRDSTADVVLDDGQVSRRHAEIRLVDGRDIVVTDLGSRNGTFIDGKRIDRPTRLVPGSVLRVGDTELEVRAPAHAAAAAPPAVPPGAATPSMVERSMLRRMVRRSNWISIAAVALAAVVLAAGVVVVAPLVTAPKPLTLAEVISAASPGVFRIRTGIEDDANYAFGTAWAYDGPGGLLVTNNHVVADGPPWDVTNEKYGRHTIELVGTAPCEDLAVVRVKDITGLASLPLGDQGQIRAGDPVVALGYPAGLTTAASVTATSGVVSIARQPLDPRADPNDPAFPNTITTDAAINPGNSGGPLLDARGRVIGVDTLTNTSQFGRTIQSQGYALGIDQVRTVVAKLAKGRSYGWAGLAGFTSTLDISNETLTTAGFPTDRAGLIPETITPSSAAAKAGFKSLENLITAVDGHALDGTVDSFCKAAGSKATGETIELTVYLGGVAEPQTIRLTLD